MQIYPTGSAFCCGTPLSWTYCNFTTEGSNAPFSIPEGRLIVNNRTSGIIGLNDTNAPSTIVSTVTASASTLIRTAATASPISKGTVATVAAGVGAPLGLALFATLLFLWKQRKRANYLRKQADACEKRSAALERKKGVGDQDDGVLALGREVLECQLAYTDIGPQLDGNGISELHEYPLGELY